MTLRPTTSPLSGIRRAVLLVTVVALAAVLAACSGSTHPTASSSAASQSGTATGNTASGKPNIVFVLTDDLQWNLVSHMPHVQALQRTGTTLSNYYVVDSLCCPSRSAIFTGEYPHDDGVFTNSGSDGGYTAYNSHGDQQKSFALSLQHAGYTTGFMGKYLNGYQPSDAIPPGWNEWDVAGNGYPEFDYTLNQDGKQVHYGHQANDYLVDVMSQKAGSFIDSTAAEHRPFMLELATFAPHAPYTPAPRYANAAADVAYPKTPAYDTTPTNPPSWLKGRAPLTGKQEQKLLNGYRKRIEADDAVDDLIANVENHLSSTGQLDNTYLVFSSDNGYHMGEYRLLAGKQTAFDTDIHVPLVISGPGVARGHDATQLASNIDLAATFETMAGASRSTSMDGTSLTPLLHGTTATHWQQAVLIEHHGPDDQPGDPDRQNAKHADPPSYEAIRTASALYVRYSTGEQEYYDVATDPYELHNLGAGAAPATMRAMLSALQNCHDSSACQAAAGA